MERPSKSGMSRLDDQDTCCGTSGSMAGVGKAGEDVTIRIFLFHKGFQPGAPVVHEADHVAHELGINGQQVRKLGGL